MRNLWRFSLIGSTLTLLLGGFQNCGGKASEFENVAASNAAAFFAYPYTSTPTYYADMAVYQSAGDTSGKLSQFQVVVAVRNVLDTTAATVYQVEVVGPDKSTVCPTQTGTMVPPVTTMTFQCVSSNPSTDITLILTLGTGSAQQVIQKQFNL